MSIEKTQQQSWLAERLRNLEGGPLYLVIRDALGPCWRLERQAAHQRQADQRWYGSSVSDPAIEAYAAVAMDDGEAEEAKLVNAEWWDWIWLGRYKTADGGDI